MSGVPDPLYVQARRVLLDATDALADQLDAIVLVGAQAIYLRTGDADLAVAEYTTDADFSIGPGDLTDAPLLAELMAAGGFTPDQQPGAWLSRDGITVDLMVPDALAGPGSRGARLGAHGRALHRYRPSARQRRTRHPASSTNDTHRRDGRTPRRSERRYCQPERNGRGNRPT